MEELVQSVNNITEALKSGTPAWITIIAGLAPIFLTVITIIVSICMDKKNRELQELIHKQNTELQRLIHNRDVFNQSRHDILDIYNAFSESAKSIQIYGTVETIFSNEQSAIFWNQEINNKKSEIIKACDKAKLLFGDQELMECLLKAQTAYQEICTCASRYIYNNTYMQVLQNARTGTASQFGPVAYDIAGLAINTAARECLIKLCENENTREIAQKIKAFIDLVNEDRFDKLFKKYLEIKELTEKPE